MSEKPLLLPSAKRTLIARLPAQAGESAYASYVYWGALGVGAIMVLVGLADVTSRVAALFPQLDNKTVFSAFAPVAALDVPEFNAPVATASGAIIPVRISVPSIGVNAEVIQVGKKADGTMGTPSDFRQVAWYSLGSKPGATGNAVFAGHVNNALTTAGVFSNLSKVEIGDYITVTDENGKSLVYQVSEKTQYPADEAPAAEIFTTTGSSKIVLITCDGDWVASERSFDKRLVVTAVQSFR